MPTAESQAGVSIDSKNTENSFWLTFMSDTVYPNKKTKVFLWSLINWTLLYNEFWQMNLSKNKKLFMKNGDFEINLWFYFWWSDECEVGKECCGWAVASLVLARALVCTGSVILGIIRPVHSGLQNCNAVSKELPRNCLRFGEPVFRRMTEVQARFCSFREGWKWLTVYIGKPFCV